MNTKLTSFLRHMIAPVATYLMSADMKVVAASAVASGFAYAWSFLEKTLANVSTK